MKIAYESEADGLTITLKGKALDGHVASELRNTLKELIERSDDKNITIDLSHVQFLDSSGFGALVMLLKFAQKNERQLTLSNLTGQVQSTFQMLNLDKLFAVKSSA